MSHETPADPPPCQSGPPPHYAPPPLDDLRDPAVHTDTHERGRAACLAALAEHGHVKTPAGRWVRRDENEGDAR